MHPYHMIDPSPWPFLVSQGLYFSAFGFVYYLHSYYGGATMFNIGFLLLISSLTCWWIDMIRESTLECVYTRKIRQNFRIGMALFILSEVMFFVSFFWAFFHSSLSPSEALGCVWPPVGMPTIGAFGIPLWNTVALLTSGFVVTHSHFAFRYATVKEAWWYLAGTILIGIAFTVFQLLEYMAAPFSISDSVYGSVFYMLTGFHGVHVIIGTIFLTVCLVRMYLAHYSKDMHISFELAIWYWHFVDFVWILVFLFLYIYSNYVP